MPRMMPETPDQSLPWTLAAALRWLRGLLPADLREEAEALLLGTLELPRSDLFSRPEAALDAAQIARLGAAAQRLASGEPLAYVLGRQGFWTFDLEVGPEVLIPRPDTESLVREALQRVPSDATLRLADLGTGSGALALALAAERPGCRVLAVDRSLAALRVARRNARRYRLENLDWLAADWLQPLNMQFDLIAANPPYLAEDDPHLLRDGLDREPRLALVSGPDGLQAIRDIIDQARGRLRPGAWLLLEHGWEQGAAVRELLRRGGYAEVFSARDLAERERVSGGLRPA
jgi:release factor glutamine methyltransferase